MQEITLSYIQSIFQKRSKDSHKGTFGHALLIAGNEFRMGAAVIASKACLRSGCGLLTVSVPKEERQILQISIPEAMLMDRNLPIDFEHFTSIGIGPAIGLESASIDLVKSSLNTKKPLVIDADALTILSKSTALLKSLPPQTILTPHPKEFNRLFGEYSSRDEQIKTAQQKAKELNCILILKGHQTIITDGESTFINTTGNSGLAKGGSGDALTGIITSLLAQGYSPLNASIMGVFIHGSAADLTLQTQSEESLLITDVIENLGKVFKKIQ
jgi:hydroxyethylthiazole kinase-like uncharacterized protein yjeF